MDSTSTILYCRCAYAKVVPQDVKDGVLQRLSESGVSFDCVADLCEMSAKKDPSLKRLAGQEGLKIAACYPRAVRWLFAAAGAPLDKERVQIINMRTEDSQTAADALLEPASSTLQEDAT